jgi:Cu(I)/Ag(I) efflux system membrane fusion protein
METIIQEQTENKRVTTRNFLGMPVYAWLLLVLIGTGAAWWYVTHHEQLGKGKPTVSTTTAATNDMVSLSDRSIVRSNITVAPVVYREFSNQISAVGILRIAEDKERMVTARTRGRIEKLYASTTGSFVKKGTPLYDFYSPDILNAEQELLVARNSNTIRDSGTTDPHASSSRALIRAGERRLALFGMSYAQIDHLESNQIIADEVTILAPESGVVIQKYSEEGAFVEEGSPLYQLADLSTLWAEVNIPESYIRNVAIGQTATIRTEAYPDRVFRGSVIFISPIEDQSSRSISVRIALPNGDMKLRASMTFTASFAGNTSRSLAVPSSAVIRTGKGDFVWVHESGEMFRSHQVTIGTRSSDDYYQVLSGLDKGEEVAATGAFMIDAEHQITENNPMATMHMSGGDQGSKKSGDGTGVVRAIDAGQQMITLDHGTVPGVMAAMTMAYKVADAKFVTSVKPNQSVRFTLTQMDNGEYFITEIKAQ